MGHASSTIKNCRDADLFYSGSSDEDKDKDRPMVRIKIVMPSADESEDSEFSNAETDVSSFRVLNFSEDPGERSPTSVAIASAPQHHPHFKSPLAKQVEAPCSEHFLPQVFSTLFKFAETFSHHSCDRDAFMAFIESGMWASYLDADVYDSLLSSSTSVGLGTPRTQSSSLSPLARQVVESEILTDGMLNMDRARVENCFSPDELRALTLAVLAVCYGRYCNDPDGAELPQSCPAQSGTYLSESLSQYSLGCSLRPWEPALPLEPAEDGSTFFVDPLTALRVTVRSTSRREFALLLSEGDWASKFLPVFHEMELSLTVSEVVRSQCGSVHFPLFYANKHCGASLRGETGPPVFDLQRLWSSGEEGPDSVTAAWARGHATKSKLRRGGGGGGGDGPAQTVLASCLPVRNGDSQAEYILSIHQPIASALATSRQQAILRMGDFLLFCFGTVLAGR